jgi:HEPN domain-containing protein
VKDETKDWVEIAESDRKMADSGMRRKLYAQAIYHSQQSVEKLLKGILTERGIPFRKTHDLVELSDLGAIELGAVRRMTLTRLSDHASRSRYPGAHYTEGETRELVRESRKIEKWLRRQLT